MPVGRFRSKPYEIDAIQFIGGRSPEVARFVTMGGGLCYSELYQHDASKDVFCIVTPEGIMRAVSGDWIIKGTEGEFYPIKDSVFRSKYALTSAIE